MFWFAYGFNLFLVLWGFVLHRTRMFFYMVIMMIISGWCWYSTIMQSAVVVTAVIVVGEIAVVVN